MIENGFKNQIKRFEASRQFVFITFILLCFYGALCFAIAFSMAKLLNPSCESLTCNEETLVHRRNTYDIQSNADVDGHDLMHVHSRDPSIARSVCDMFDDCLGYNSNGWLKTSLSVRNSNQADFHVKKLNRQKAGAGDNMGAVTSDYTSMLADMKVYVYDTRVGNRLQARRIGPYAVERVFMETLFKSSLITRDAEEATHFFIPIRCASYVLGQHSEAEGLRIARQTVADMLSEIQSKYPYWTRARGADHFYMCAHDVGAAVGATTGLKNAIALVNTADYEDPYFIPHKDISLPPTVSQGLENFAQAAKGGANIKPSSRHTLAFFAGDVTSGRIRQRIWNLWAGDPDILILDHLLTTKQYVEHLKTARFCLVVRGREVWSSRLVEAMYGGCVPTIISDHYHLPLQGVVDWRRFAVIVPESQVGLLKRILSTIGEREVRDMQLALADAVPHFVWSGAAHDAFHGIMLQLWRRRHVVRYKHAL